MAKTPYSIKVDDTILNDMREVAEKQHRSVNNAIEMAMLEYIEKHKS